MDTMRFFFLGVIDLSYGKQSLTKPATFKSQSLLAYLVMHPGTPQTRERLADLFWGDWPSEKARRNLSTALWRVRRCFPVEILDSDTHSVCFNFSENYQLDVETFEALIEKDDATSLEEAIKLYRGDFLEGFYDDWVVNTRYRLETFYFDALARLIAIRAASGDYQACLETALRLIELDPLREDAHRHAMYSFASLGQKSKALAQYQHCRQVLKSELGIEPTAETFQLYQDIQAGHEAALPSVDELADTVVDPKIADLPKAGRDPRDVLALSRLVGREAEMATLDQCWGRAKAVGGGFLLVSGEAGVGKSRLVNEFSQRLRASGASTSVSRCYEFEGALPYQPIAEAIRNTLENQGTGVLRDMPPWAQMGFFELVPEIMEQVTRQEALPQNQGAQSQARLFESVLSCLTRLAKDKPILLALEDLHWARESTIEMIHYLARNLVNKPILILGTSRSEALDENHPLWRLEGQLKREGMMESLKLARLSENAILEMVAEASGAGEATNPLAKRLYEESHGNPFYLIEMIKTLFEAEIITFQENTWGGDFQTISQIDLPMPSSISQAVQRRVGRLSEEHRDVLENAAILGREIEYEVLKKLTKGGEEDFLDVLDELLRRQFIEESGPSVAKDYQFVHHKIQEAIYEGIPLRRRTFLHRRAGERLENFLNLGRAELAGEIAYHLMNAQPMDQGLVSKTITYLNMAGNQARLLYAHKEALEYYEKALALYRQNEDNEGAARTLMKLGLTYHNAFAYDRARQVFDESFALLRHVARLKPTQQPPAPHALRYWTPLEPNTLDPATCSEFCTSKIVHQLYRGPLELTSELDVMPAMFQSWEVSPDGRRYSFHLLKDAIWSDGQPLTAGDFEFAWKRLLNPSLDSLDAELFYMIKGARAFHKGTSPDPDQVGIKTQDDRTLIVEMEEPAGYFLHLLTNHIAVPLPRHLLNKDSASKLNQWESQMEFVSNGAFLIRSWHPGNNLALVCNPNYSGEIRGNLKEARIYFMDWPEALGCYETGDLDILDLTYTTQEQRNFIYRRFPDEYLTDPLQQVMFVLMNTNEPPFEDVRVRQAFAQAIDKRLLVQCTVEGEPAFGGIVPPGIPGYLPDIGLPYNPEKGRELLAQAGYPGGKGFPPFRAYAQDNPKYTSLNNELARQWLQNLGVSLEWNWFTTENFFTQSIADKPNLSCYGLAPEYPDPEYFLHRGIFPYMRSEFVPGYLEHLHTARGIKEPVERLSYYRTIDLALVEQAAIIPLVYPRTRMLVKPWVKGFSLAHSVGEWKHVIIEPHD